MLNNVFTPESIYEEKVLPKLTGYQRGILVEHYAKQLQKENEYLKSQQYLQDNKKTIKEKDFEIGVLKSELQEKEQLLQGELTKRNLKYQEKIESLKNELDNVLENYRYLKIKYLEETGNYFTVNKL